MRFNAADVAERVLRSRGRNNTGSGSALDSLSSDVEAHMAGQDLEALLLGWVEVLRNIPARIREDLGAQDLPVARERKPLAANWIVNELGHRNSFCLGPYYKSPMSDIATRSGGRGRRARRRLPTEQRRETLAKSASELFAQQGYDHVTLDEVAARAGVTKVIVYRHFGSKKDLYLTLLAAHRDQLLRTLAEGMAVKRPLPRRVEAVADAWFRYVQTHPFAWKMLFQDVTGDPEIRAFHAGMRTTARAAIIGLLQAERSLDLDSSTIEPVAELLRASMTGLALWWLDNPQAERATLVQTIIQTTWQGLAGATRTRS